MNKAKAICEEATEKIIKSKHIVRPKKKGGSKTCTCNGKNT